MTGSSIIVAALLSLAVLIAVVFSIGILVMRDALRRLHFITPVAALSTFLIVVAIWVADSQAQSRIKSVLIGLAMFIANAIIGHTNARAFRLRAKGHFDPRPQEQIPVDGQDQFAGERPVPMVEP